MLENGALWANFIQNGALIPIDKNRKKLNSIQQPHLKVASCDVGP